MKFTSALSTVLALLPAVTYAVAIPAPVDATNLQRRDNSVVARDVLVARQNRNVQQNRNQQNRNQQNRNQQNRNQQNRNGQNRNGQNNAPPAAAPPAAAPPAAAPPAAAAPPPVVNEDPQESLTLLAELVAPGLAQDGQDPPVAGQVASLTSVNNFINFCIGQTITNGQQLREGSCNPVPMGDIIPKATMPSSKFTSPPNFGTIPANTQFLASIAVQNMNTGFFTNAQQNYFAAPQQLQNGILVAHSHIVIQEIESLESTQVLNALDFAFFKGLNDPAVGGILTADVTNGLPAGVYRMASIHTSANHAPAIASVAQHGFFDDITYFTVV